MTATGKTSDRLPRALKKIYGGLRMHAIIGFFITIIIIIIIIASLYGGETFLDDKGEKAYRVSWEEKTGPEVPYSRQLIEREELIIENTVTQTNLTTIQFELFWEDNRGGIIRNLSDDLTMKIESPPNAKVRFQDPNPLQGYQSPLLITAAVNTIPNDLTLVGIDSNDLSSKLADYSTTNGIGNWKIILSIDADPPLDRGNTISLVVTYHYYESHIEAAA